jgi:hypothetical protein
MAKQKANPLFGKDHLQRVCVDEWEGFLSQDPDRSAAISEISKQTGEDVSSALSAGGAIHAANITLTAISEMVVTGDLDSVAADEITDLLKKFQERIPEDRIRKAAEDAEKRAGAKKKDEKSAGSAAVAVAIGFIHDNNDDLVYRMVYQERLIALEVLLAQPENEEKRIAFYRNCARIDSRPDIEVDDDVSVPPLALALVQFCWIDDKDVREEAFLNSSLMVEV